MAELCKPGARIGELCAAGDDAVAECAGLLYCCECAELKQRSSASFVQGCRQGLQGQDHREGHRLPHLRVGEQARQSSFCCQRLSKWIADASFSAVSSATARRQRTTQRSSKTAMWSRCAPCHSLRDLCFELQAPDVLVLSCRDLAAHIDGFIATTAHTLVVTSQEVTGQAADLLQAALTALEAAIRLIRPGARSTEVAPTLQKVSFRNKIAVLLHQRRPGAAQPSLAAAALHCSRQRSQPLRPPAGLSGQAHGPQSLQKLSS